MRAVCDLSYAAQVEQLERQSLTLMSMAPHMEDSSKIATPDQALREFQEWLISKPEGADVAPQDAELLSLIGVDR